MRQRSAVAAVLRRQKQKMRQANSLLNKAHSEAPWSSYAGYRVLARLSLACRWLEWGRRKKAVEQLGAAREDAIHMLDPVLSQERLDLIAAFAGWLQEVDTSKEPKNSDACLRKARDQMGMQRSLYLQYLSAIWYPDIWRLKALLPLALEDATATDAVLGRLIGAISLGEQPGISFERLVEVMGLEALT